MADDARTFQFYEPLFAPNYLREKYGNAWLEAQGLLRDGILRTQWEAAKSGTALAAPVDALRYIGENVKIDRGPSEDDATYRARTGKPFSTHSWDATDKGILDTLAAYGLTAYIRRNREFEGHYPSLMPFTWARMWVVIQQPNPWRAHDTFDNVEASGLTSDAAEAAGMTWDCTASPDEIARIRKAVLDRSDASVHIPEIVVLLDPGPPIDRLWDDPYSTDTFDDVEAASLEGDGEAAYWEGW